MLLARPPAATITPSPARTHVTQRKRPGLQVPAAAEVDGCGGRHPQSSQRLFIRWTRVHPGPSSRAPYGPASVIPGAARRDHRAMLENRAWGRHSSTFVRSLMITEQQIHQVIGSAAVANDGGKLGKVGEV